MIHLTGTPSPDPTGASLLDPTGGLLSSKPYSLALRKLLDSQLVFVLRRIHPKISSKLLLASPRNVVPTFTPYSGRDQTSRFFVYNRFYNQCNTLRMICGI